MNRGILSPFVTWDTRSIPRSGLGIHTHRNFTMDLCINAMQCEAYTDSFMHASGMMVFQKRPLVMHFMNEWLHYNLIPECACLGDPNIPDDYSYWTDHEDRYKMGHRHDQSISGLILNQMDHDLIQPPPAEYHPYNFLNFCRVGHNYQFVNSNTPVEPMRIKKGDTVRNTAGETLRVFDIWPGGVNEYYIVGKHRESAYKTTEDKIKVVTDDIQVSAILNK
jgi:hypothetical protein